MQGKYPVDGGVKALEELLVAYKRLLNTNPTRAKMDCCVEAHEKALGVLRDDDLCKCLDTLLKMVRDQSVKTVDDALERLEHPDSWEEEIEYGLGQALGFNRRQFNALLKEAKRGLRSAQSREHEPVVPETTSMLAEILTRIHEPTMEMIRSSRKVKKDGQKPRPRLKRKAKSSARHEIRRELFLVGSIVANGRSENVFPRSYAMSMGLAACAR